MKEQLAEADIAKDEGKVNNKTPLWKILFEG
jgi:hypothetical protein